MHWHRAFGHCCVDDLHGARANVSRLATTSLTAAARCVLQQYHTEPLHREAHRTEAERAASAHAVAMVQTKLQGRCATYGIAASRQEPMTRAKQRTDRAARSPITFIIETSEHVSMCCGIIRCVI